MKNTALETSGYETTTNEELVSLIQNGADGFTADKAYGQLFKNLRPVILGEAKMYQGKMVTYDTDDFLQEGFILIWKTMKTFKGGNYKSYFISAMRFRLCSIYEKYITKNAICIAESEDYRGYGYTVQTLVESDKAKKYRKKKNARQRRYIAKKKAEREAAAKAEREALGLPEPEPKKPLTKEERTAKQVAYQKAYYAAHPDKLEERRAKAREYERRKREAKKAEKMAAAAESKA